MEKKDIDQHILNYLQGSASVDEIESLRAWIKEDKSNKAAFETIRAYWSDSSLRVQYPDIDAAYLRLKSMSKIEGAANIRSISPVRNHRSFSWIKYAAALFLFISLSALFYLSIDQNKELALHENVKSIVKQNPKGQKLTTFLPDGSKVILNSESRIEYLPSFNGQERLVVLDGEAFFEVKKDKSKPFRVKAGSTSVVALGTSFNVNSKARDKVEVALVTGSVEVSDKTDQSVVLTPGKSALINDAGFILVNDFHFDEKVGWKDGLLVFRDNSLDEILEKLKDWYGVDILSELSINQNEHFSGKYRNESLEEVLEGIAFVHHFDFEIKGDTARIYNQ